MLDDARTSGGFVPRSDNDGRLPPPALRGERVAVWERLGGASRLRSAPKTDSDLLPETRHLPSPIEADSTWGLIGGHRGQANSPTQPSLGQQSHDGCLEQSDGRSQP